MAEIAHIMWRLGACSIFVLLGMTSAAADPVVISRADCARIVAHDAAPDVAYEPGVDSRGRPVTSAGVEDDVRLHLDAEDVVIEIAVPLRAFSGTPGDEAGFTDAGGKIDRYEATAYVGVVALRGGVLYLDGQPISSRERELLAAACRDR